VLAGTANDEAISHFRSVLRGSGRKFLRGQEGNPRTIGAPAHRIRGV